MHAWITRLAGAAIALAVAGTAHSRSSYEPLSEGEVLSFMESRVPGSFAVLNETREMDPEQYQQQILEFSEQIHDYNAIRGEAPVKAEQLLEHQKLQIGVLALRNRLAATDDEAKRDHLVERLREVLGRQFDLELKQPESELLRLENEVERVRGLIEDRKASKEEILDLRLKSFLDALEKKAE